MDVIKVSAKSRSTSVAGAIAGVIRENGKAEVQAIWGRRCKPGR